jgi:hypothetical protein
MDDATYWWEEAVEYRRRAKLIKEAKASEDSVELLDLAAVCEEVSAAIAERGPSG